MMDNLPCIRGPLQPVGKCIYCLSTQYDPNKLEARLAREHIIPRGLGGRISLPRASCRKCEKMTTAFETKVISAIASNNRANLNIHGQKASRHAHRRVDTNPSILPIAKFDPPGILSGRLVEEKVFLAQLHGVKTSADFDSRFKAGGSRLRFNFGHGFLVEEFGQVLAKIAHSYAVATIGLEAFEPTLLPVIEGVSDTYVALLTHLVGSEENIPPKTPNWRHSVTHAWQRLPDGQEALVVGIRLFGDLGAPSHLAIAGLRPVAT